MSESIDQPILLFLCVANSARSQMAEGLARTLAPAGVEVMSAGSKATSVNPLAIQGLAERGIDASSHSSKSVESIPAARVRWVVTLCAEEVCPIFPGMVKRIAWPLPDPASAQGTRAAQLAAFVEVRDEIECRLRELFAAWPPS